MAKKKKGKGASKAPEATETATEPTEVEPAAPTEAPSADDGVVTSAPASSVGSLLTDLLSEAQREADEERASLKEQISARNAEESAQKESSEAAKREEMQRKLIEETRRRNEVLTRQQRADATAKALKDAQPMLASADSVGDFEGQAKNASSSKMWMGIAIVAILAAAGLGAVSSSTSGKLGEAQVQNEEQAKANKALSASVAELEAKVVAQEKSLKSTQDELAQATKDRKAAEAAKTKLAETKLELDGKLKAANEELQKLKEAGGDKASASKGKRNGKRPARRGRSLIRRVF